MFNWKARAIKSEILLILHKKLMHIRDERENYYSKRDQALHHEQKSRHITPEQFEKRKKDRVEWFNYRIATMYDEENLLEKLIKEVEAVK